MRKWNNLGTKRTLSFTPLPEENQQLREKKAKQLEHLFNTTDEFFGVRYWIDEEQRWMLPSEEEKYLNESHYTNIEYPLEYHGTGNSGPLGRHCYHCGEVVGKHQGTMLRRLAGFSEYAWACGTVDYCPGQDAEGESFKYLVGIHHYNKYTKSIVGDVEVLTESEYMYHAKLTQ